MRTVDCWRSTVDGERLRIEARLRVRGDDPNLRGHFPDLAILPGVFVVEAVGHAMAHAFAGSGTPRPRLRLVRSARFLAPLFDGDVLTLRLDVTRLPSGGWSVDARGTRADGTTTSRIRAEFAEAGDA
jgi:3-hydroxyacyl-[acyl-carrier-protein] dehydratase